MHGVAWKSKARCSATNLKYRERDYDWDVIQRLEDCYGDSEKFRPSQTSQNVYRYVTGTQNHLYGNDANYSRDWKQEGMVHILDIDTSVYEFRIRRHD